MPSLHAVRVTGRRAKNVRPRPRTSVQRTTSLAAQRGNVIRFCPSTVLSIEGEEWVGAGSRQVEGENKREMVYGGEGQEAVKKYSIGRSGLYAVPLSPRHMQPGTATVRTNRYGVAEARRASFNR